MPRYNVLIVLADQWRAQAAGYAGDVNARTPNLDAFSRESIRCETAVSVCPVCTPARASLITGQYPLTHRPIMNDLCLGTKGTSFADAFRSAGYQTGYIGKWHLDGHGRSAFIPPERRQGFEMWMGTECNHNYQNGFFHDETGERRPWEGYEPEAQTDAALRFLRDRDRSIPFAFVLAWGPPHSPYHTAPERFREGYHPEAIALRPNVPESAALNAREELCGYYAHIEALDACFGRLTAGLGARGLAEETIILFTSDHGDMLGSHGLRRKQQPFDGSILVPFLLRCPRGSGVMPRSIGAPISTPDIMPTLLGLCDIPVPPSVEGMDFAPALRHAENIPDRPALFANYAPFGEWSRKKGGQEFRGVRTSRYTYVRDLAGPWLLFDNREDPCQTRNLCAEAAHASLRRELDGALLAQLASVGDESLPAADYIARWNYKVNADGAVPYTH